MLESSVVSLEEVTINFRCLVKACEILQKYASHLRGKIPQRFCLVEGLYSIAKLGIMSGGQAIKR